MRTWPYQMLEYLPTKQLVAQWRECIAISGMIASLEEFKETGSLEGINHATINRVKDYPLTHFAAYCDLVRLAFKKRGFIIGTNTIEKLNNNINYQNLNYFLEENFDNGISYYKVDGKCLFEDFHNIRYIKQCLYSFQEKYDCDMLYEEEWKLLLDNFGFLLGE